MMTRNLIEVFTTVSISPLYLTTISQHYEKKFMFLFMPGKSNLYNYLNESGQINTENPPLLTYICFLNYFVYLFINYCVYKFINYMCICKVWIITYWLEITSRLWCRPHQHFKIQLEFSSKYPGNFHKMNTS